MARSGTNHKGGRPKGKKSPKTLEKEAVIAAFRQRAMRVAGLLLDSQLTLARGQTFLYRIDKEKIEVGKKIWYKKSRPVLVTAQSEIEDYLEGRIEEGDEEDEHDPGASYYFLTTKEPNNSAIDAILDRTFGKTIQAMKITDDDGRSMPITSINVVPVPTIQ